MTTQHPSGASRHDSETATGRWPRRRVIWSCTASRGKLLTRYFLLHTRALGIYLHRLHISDDDRALHDHPWPFVTFLLSSGYWEWTPPTGCCLYGDCSVPERQWRRRFSVLYRPARYRHRLDLARPTWTLVVRFRRIREWGFWTPRGWLHWQAYGKEWCD